MLLLRVTDALSRARVSYAVAGGYAVALHGAVRGTVDVDLVIRASQKQFEAAERALKKLGLDPRLPVTASQVFQFRDEYIENRNLTAWTFENASKPTEIVDIILTHDLDELETVTRTINGKRVRIVSIDDLIEMKSASGRPQDKEDVKALKRIREDV